MNDQRNNENSLSIVGRLKLQLPMVLNILDDVFIFNLSLYLFSVFYHTINYLYIFLGYNLMIIVVFLVHLKRNSYRASMKKVHNTHFRVYFFLNGFNQFFFSFNIHKTLN